MALGMGMLRCGREHVASILGFRRWNHIAAMPPPLFGAIEPKIASPQFVLPEFDREAHKDNHVGFGFPSFSFGSSMELMAVPKRKKYEWVAGRFDRSSVLLVIMTSPHKRGIRNGPKALKPVPVIIRCKSCGRVKLPHYYCCSGHRGDASNGPMS